MDPQERYTIKRRIEQSGVCAVYEGFDKQLQRKVAIKRLLSEDESGKDYEDLMRECQSLSALTSANIVSLHDVGRDEDGPFMVLELLEGDSLQKLIDDGIVELEDFYQIAEQTLEGLSAAHDIHLIHRDLKPSNINVFRRPSGRLLVKLQDFGLAKFSLEPSIRTIAHSNTLFGSIYYMAPEQFERQPLDNRTDIYSLGAVFYHMLSGQYPYDGASGAQVMIGAMNGGATDLAELRPDLEPALCAWVMAMLAKEPVDRPASCADALDGLAGLRSGKARSASLAVPTIPEAAAAPAPAPATAEPSVTQHQAEAQPQTAGVAAALAAAAVPTEPSVEPPLTAPQEQIPHATSPNPMPSGPAIPGQMAAGIPPQEHLPTVELAAAQGTYPQTPGTAPVAGHPATTAMHYPQQQHPQQQAAIPAPQSTVQMITGGPQPTRALVSPSGPLPTSPMGAAPAPRITGPIRGTGQALGHIGGPALMTGGRATPLPKGSSFSSKQSGSSWWVWLVGASAAAITVLIVINGNSSAAPKNPSTADATVGSAVPVSGQNAGMINTDTAPAKPAKHLAEELGLPEDSAEILFKKRDKDGNFQLSRDEFIIGSTEAQENELENAFNMLDKNADGRLHLSELYRAYRPLTFF